MVVDRFLRWWGGELAALLPRAMVRASGAQAHTLHVDVAAEAVHVRYRTNGRVRELGRVPRVGAAESVSSARRDATLRLQKLDPKSTRMLVTLQGGQALSKVVTLPLAAQENLPEVLSFQMERETPFRREDVYFSHRVLERDTDKGQLLVQLNVAPRRIVDEALTLTNGWNASAAALPEDAGVSSEGVPLCFHPRGYREGRPTRLNLALGVLNVALLGAVVGIPLLEQQNELERLRAELERAREDAQAAVSLRDRVKSLEQELSFVAERKRTHSSMVLLLEELTTLLPDSTWLYRLEVKDGTVHLQGVSEAASSLIARIEASSMFREVRFGSPVTQDNRSGLERFRLSAEIVNGSPEA